MIDYSIIKNEETNFVAIRSTVKSFNLDHVTDKELSSFYNHLSKYAHIDTGLLPLEGTGLLAYRQAGNHAQIIVQHAPGVSRVMWGAHEGDSSAKTYFLAQPYRVYVGDILDGNFYGARIFYSPYPITSPSNELYHVNLPNINCRGYRGNGVGWVCLYHRDDWTQIPLGEKVSRLIERCSGAEAYNDANMSETDGPRFYAANGKPSYLYDPTIWEKKTEEEGFHWTLDPDMWIPILVKDRDNQGSHDKNGIPLTLGMALTGDYQAYYTDHVHTKPVNAIAREDKVFSSDYVFDLIKKSYLEASVENTHADRLDPYVHTQKIRDSYSKTKSVSSHIGSDDDNDDYFVCCNCEEQFPMEPEGPWSDPNGNDWCEDCQSDHWSFCEHIGEYVPVEETYYAEYMDQYIYTNDPQAVSCDHCGTYFLKSSKKGHHIINDSCCTECIASIGFPYEVHTCVTCNDTLYVYEGSESFYKTFKHYGIDDTGGVGIVSTGYYHNECVGSFTVCPCGVPRQEEADSSIDVLNYLEIISPEVMVNVSQNFNPVQEIFNHNNKIIPDPNKCPTFGKACASCVCKNGDQLLFDPSKFDSLYFNPELLPEIHSSNSNTTTPVNLTDLLNSLTNDEEPF